MSRCGGELGGGENGSYQYMIMNTKQQRECKVLENTMIENQWGFNTENSTESVKYIWLTCSFSEEFSQQMCKASLIFSSKNVEAVSRIKKQFSEHKALHVSDQ